MIKNMEFNIWAVFRHYYPNFAGTAVQGQMIFNQMVEDGYKVQVIAAADHKAKELAGKEIYKDNLKIKYLPVIHRRNWYSSRNYSFVRKLSAYINGLINNLSYSLQVSRLLWRNGQINDIVHLHSINEFSFLIEWCVKVRGMHPLVHMTLLGSDDPKSILQKGKPLFKYLTFLSFHLSEAIISLSSAQTESCRQAGIDMNKVHEIPCAVNLQVFHPISQEERSQIHGLLNLPANRRYIVFVGSALYRKGIEILIRSFIQVASQVHDVDLLIVGPNDFSDNSRHEPSRAQLICDLKEELVEAGCSSRVKWVGSVDNVYAYLQAAEIFCLPSRREGFGIVIIEAMAIGLPVVTSRLEGVTTDHFEQYREGIFVDSFNPHEYASVFLQLLTDHALAEQIGQAANTIAKKKFGLDLIADKFTQLYIKLSGGVHV